ncbi:transposase [Pasteurellaceae bacterium Macca]|nr:transposase [Pasteurellaceae bacterium Macca]
MQAFEKQGINGLLPKPKGRPVMKSKSPKMPRFKTEEERLRYRILELEAEVAVLKKLRELNQQKMAKKPKSSTR